MDAVVVIHGLWMTGHELYFLRKRLIAGGLQTHKFSYRSTAEGLDENAARLATFLRDVPGDRVHLVGHSLGGVVILKMLERFPPSRPGRVVCLASPLRGSLAARALAVSSMGALLLGNSTVYFLNEKGLDAWSGHHQLGVIAGDVPVGIGRCFGDVPFPNDGMIAVEETVLAGAKDHIVLRASHFSILVSKGAANQVLHFLRYGSFIHESSDNATNS